MPDNRIALMEYRIQTAKEKLHSAEVLLAANEYKDSISRSYYSMFTMVRAVLALDKVDFSKHAGVISYFQKEYIKTAKIDKEYSKMISNAFKIRNNCDYQDFFLVSKAEAVEQCENAKKFIKTLEFYLAERLHQAEKFGK